MYKIIVCYIDQDESGSTAMVVLEYDTLQPAELALERLKHTVFDVTPLW